MVSRLRTQRRSAVIAVAVVSVATAMATMPTAHAGASSQAATGTFTTLSYNVAGLPEPLSGSSPDKNTKLISPRLNAYDVVNVQEDFAYDDDLRKHDEHPYRTKASAKGWIFGVPFSDGLNTFSDFRQSNLDREDWDKCTGTNCLTPKGFSFVQLEMPGGATLDLYNVHMNAGSGSAKELRVRRDNTRQLSEYIQKHSAGHAVLVMGDMNSRYTRSGDIIRELRDDNGLTDAWVELINGGKTPDIDDNAPTCKTENACEVIDKILYRSGSGLDLKATYYNNEYAKFLDSKGQQLSDHNPSTVRFTYSVR
ncbi:endonuclease/exonuclease/phosphatase family protein [Streptomyces sp. NPDC019396]|uniref:endonuclease/exonuclease/phosphatase family protein n=1 Tax=Streptomyces sp. NPDC019396 TaxID=3154687 RepID=UPI0033DF6E08